MATLVAFTGFEFGTPQGIGTGTAGNRVFDGITGTAGTDVKVTATSGPVAGNYVGEVNLTAKNFFWNTDTIGTSKTVLVVSMRFRFTTLPSGDTDIISMDTAASTDRAGFFYKQSTGKIHAWIAATTQASVASLSVNTWYTLQWKFDVSGTQTLDWALDGVTGTQVTGGSSSTIARLALGNRGAGTGTAQYDDVAVSVTSGDHPLTMFKVPPALVPDTGGTAVEIGTANATARFTTNNTVEATFNSANILAAVSELPPTIGASASGVAQRTSGATNAVGLPMTTYTLTGGETIASTRIIVCGWANGTLANNFGVRAFNGSAETTLIGDVASGFTNDTTAPDWACKSYTGLTNQTTIDALVVRLGYSTDVSPAPGAHAVYAELAIVPGSGGATATPAVVAGVGTVPAPTVSGGATSVPAAVAGVGTVPAPAVSGGARVVATAVAGVGTVPAPTLSAGSTVTPAAVAGVGTVPTPTVAAGSTVTATAVAGIGAVPAPTLSAGSTVTASAVTGTGVVPAPTLSAASTAAPGTVTGTGTIPAPTLSAGATVTATSVTAVGTVPAPTPGAGATVTATAVAAIGAVPAPAVSAGGSVTISAITVTGVAVMPAPTTTAGATAAPDTVAALGDVLPPLVGVSASIAVTTVIGAGGVPEPVVTVSGGVSATPATVIGIGLVPVPSVTAGGVPPVPSLTHVRESPIVTVLDAGPQLTHTRSPVPVHMRDQALTHTRDPVFAHINAG